MLNYVFLMKKELNETMKKLFSLGSLAYNSDQNEYARQAINYIVKNYKYEIKKEKENINNNKPG